MQNCYLYSTYQLHWNIQLISCQLGWRGEDLVLCYVMAQVDPAWLEQPGEHKAHDESYPYFFVLHKAHSEPNREACAACSYFNAGARYIEGAEFPLSDCTPTPAQLSDFLLLFFSRFFPTTIWACCSVSRLKTKTYTL